ncbi:MAG: ABC transporter permease [Pseudomonadota bacterium]
MSGGRRALPLAPRLALREMRGGLRGFRVFIACLALGVAAIAAVGAVEDGVLDTLMAKGQTLLGADVELRLTHREASEDERAYLTRHAARVSKITRLRAMARAPATDKRTLVELKAVDALYPLYGAFTTRPQLAQAALFDRDGEVWGAAVDPALAQRLGVGIGDRLSVGDARLEVRALIENEPDKANEGFLLGPTLVIAATALPATGLVRPGSLVRYHYRLGLDPAADIDAWRTALTAAFPDAGWQIRDRANGAPGVRRFVERMGLFLTLVGLTALAVGGVGVGNAVRGYLETKTRTIATLKTMGADGALIFRLYLWQVMLMAGLAIAMGLALGALAPLALSKALAARLPVTPTLGLYPAALASAAVYGFLITLIFAVWPLARAREVPAARLFRALIAPTYAWPRRRYILLIVLAVLSLAALAVLLARDSLLALGFVGAALAALGLLRAAGWGVERLAARLPRIRRPTWRIALTNLHRPGAATAAVVLSLGLGLTLFAALTGIEANMNREIAQAMPVRAPAFFFIDIQPHEVAAFRRTVAAVPGVTAVDMVPSLRAPVTRVNGVPAREVKAGADAAWVLRGDRGLTYASALPEGNRLTAGAWWPPDYAGPPLISLGDEVAAGLGLKVGDSLTLSVLGRDITATIANLRAINWGSYGFNFVIIFAPGTLEAAPHSFMATLSAEGDAEAAAYRAVTDAFPGVSVIRMKEVLASLNDLLGQIGGAVRLTALVTIVTGVLVLAGALAAGYRARVYDAVILKVLGATRGDVLKAYFLEYLILGAVTGLIALGLGTLAAFIVVTRIFETSWAWPATPMAATLGSAMALTLAFGLATTWAALSVRPNRLLAGL